ncbi:hypothetical protein [Massilia soli]|uniref:PcRGLX/YetA-like N-terminal RIFT barrel domain-containing protein n=1 Tax=Massilia soli TaxID=2792854 RepID=A0ABS7SRC2_9BURK|nr:hypothetical protein [Massilia soli]MBZ2208482.1 hypothetical protein [Massilia soli]
MAVITSIVLTPAVSAASAPHTFGHPFKMGDVPAGQSVVCSGVIDSQCIPKAYWHDGSLKFAVISVRIAATAGVPVTVTLSTGTAPAGAALTLANLKATGFAVNLALTDAKDWTFGTATHTVGARLAMSNALDVFVGASSTIAVDNGAAIGAITATQDIGTLNVVLTAPLSGGAVNGYQTVKYRAKYKVRRNISAILPGAVTRVTVTGGWKTAKTSASTDGLGVSIAAVGNTITFAGIGGMTQLNGLTGTVTKVDPSTASPTKAWVEVNIDSTGFSAFTSGGTATKNELNTSDANEADVNQDTVAYVRTGGGLAWNGTATTYSTANSTQQTGVSWAGLDWDTPFEALESGPIMSSWKFRKAIAPDPHMVAWAEVRVYKGGAVQTLPFAENGMLKVARPTAKQASMTLSINGLTQFSQTLELKSHTRTVLINGTHLSYWNIADPEIFPTHNRAYVYSTRLIPTYMHVTPDSAPTLSGQAYSSFEPFQRGNHQAGMGSAGFQADIGIIPNHDALYFTNGSRKSYEGMVRNGFSTGRYRIHYRDEANGWHRPLRFSQYPNLVMNGKDPGMTSIGISTTLEYTPTATGGTTPAGEASRTFSSSHTPAMGYAPHMITGWDYFREEMEFLATLVYLKQVNTERGLSKGILKTNVGANQTRGAAWALIHLGQAATLGKDGDALTTEMRTSLIENIKYYYNKYLAQGEVCPFGLTELYTDYGSKASVGMEASAFQSDFFTQAIGFIRNLDPLLPTDVREQLRLFSLYKYKSVIGRLGGIGATEFPYQYLGNGYDIPVSPNQLKETADRPAVNWDPTKGPTGPWFASWGEVFTRRFPGVVPVANGPLLGDFTGPGSYFSNALPGVALAVEHGAPGALDAYNRLINAPNWATQSSAYINTPVYGIVPASTTYVPPVEEPDPDPEPPVDPPVDPVDPPTISLDIKYYLAGTAGLGGTRSSVEVGASIFDDATPAERIAGRVEYRCLYPVNEGSATWKGATLFMFANTPYADSTIEVGLGTSAINGVEQVIPNETTAPVGVTFTLSATEAGGILLGDLAPQAGRATWVKRTIMANSAPRTVAVTDTFEIEVKGFKQ